ncbi:uncharacterized protein LOC62_03G003539 [Vanrija pseudolonga]|uniref:Uncharacterized protein n=1 Tax=Vanrija pseudolonga TaxID=143232 RepID=A0AAF1BJM3_9TREE|nr:hypothetical protein LOC62_03G003539 [Vanrija pseudolonga]
MGNILSKVSSSAIVLFKRHTGHAKSPDHPYEELPSEIYESPPTSPVRTPDDLVSFDSPYDELYWEPSTPPLTSKPTIRWVPPTTYRHEVLPFEDGLPLGRVVNGVRITEPRPIDLLHHFYSK